MIIIRDMQLADIPELTDLLNDIIATGGTTAIQTPETLESFTKYYLHRPSLVSSVTALHHGAPVGFQVLNRVEGTDIGSIASFADQRNVIRGVGSAMITRTIANARAQGFIAIDAVIRADNVPGLAFYSKSGFVDHSVDRDVPLMDGTLVDRITKRLML